MKHGNMHQDTFFSINWYQAVTPGFFSYLGIQFALISHPSTSPAFSQLFLSHPRYSPGVISESPSKISPYLKDFTRILSSDLDNLFVTSVLKDMSFQDEVQVMNGTISR